jgi:phosphatidylserine/phosphatidylglycerophosphate/cardiolipin synthase-like enzyme
VDVQALKAARRKIVMVTAYDYVSARVAADAGVDVVLVGDSAANTVLGYPSTRDVSLDEMAMLAAAARRGADVRLLLAGPQTDVRLARSAGRRRYETLLAAGVRIYEWQPSTLHAKTFVVDGRWSSVGTMNFDNRSLALNDEVALMVLDPEFGRRMDAMFLADLSHATEITADQFRQRPWTERVAEWGASLLTRVL